jgi:membrane protease YdiL (CAAX protease family)
MTHRPRHRGWSDRGPGVALLAAVLLGLGAMMMQCCAGCPLGILEGVLRGVGGFEGFVATHPLVLAFTSVVALGSAGALGTLLARRPLGEQLPLAGFDPWLLLPGIPAVMGLGIVMGQLCTLQEMVMPMPAWLDELFGDVLGGQQSIIGSWLLAVAIAPPLEEALFRGVLLQGLRRQWPARWAVVFTALLFTLFHANPWQVLAPLVLGLLYGWLTLRTGTLWPAIMAHALNNATALGVVALFESGAIEIAQENSPQLGPPWLVMLGLGTLLVGTLGGRLVLRRTGGALSGPGSKEEVSPGRTESG